MSFQAQYPGHCWYGDEIEPGDLCAYTDEDEIAHVECDQLNGPANIHAPKPVATCPQCHIQHAGECF